MRVHHVAPHFYPETGGLESALLRLCEFLVDRGHEVVVHTSSRSYLGRELPAQGTFGRVLIRRYRPFRLGYYATVFRPDVTGADLVHLHAYGFVTNDRAARRLRGRVPLVYSLYHGVAQPAPGIPARVKRALYDPLLGLRTLRAVDAILPLSEADRAWLERRRFSPERVHVIPTGLDSLALRPGSGERAREAFGLGRYVLFVGRLHREKSPDHLLRALATLPRWEVPAVFVGPDAGAKRDLEVAAATLGTTPRLRILGEVDEAAKRDLLSGAECLVLPSFYESQGIVILEAWAQGRPVIASAVGGVPYVVRDGRDGLLYPWGDIPALARHLDRILADPATADAMGAAGRQKAQTQYAWDRLAPRYLEVYERVTRAAARG